MAAVFDRGPRKLLGFRERQPGVPVII